MKGIFEDNRGQINAGGGVIAFIILVIIVAVAFGISYKSVPNGHVAYVNTWNVVEDQPVAPGFYTWQNPFRDFEVVDVRTQHHEFKDITGTLTSEGVEIKGMDASILWHRDPAKVPEVAKTVSGDPFETIVVPNFMGILRGEFKKYPLEDIYTGDKVSIIQDDVFNRLNSITAPRGIIIETVQFRGVTLPDKVQETVQAKANAKTEAETMFFKLQGAQTQYNITILNARATAQANAEIAKSITPEIVQWRRYQVLESLINNKNAMLVDIGDRGTSGGTPLIQMPVKNS